MNEDIVFTVGEHEYSAGALDAKRQFHILRRLAPILGGAADDGSLSRNDFSLKGALDAIGTLPDEQFDYIADHCLSVTKRRDGGIWAAVSSPAPGGGRVLMYKDIDLVAMCAIVFHVLQGNLSGFFDAIPSDIKEQVQSTISSISQ